MSEQGDSSSAEEVESPRSVVTDASETRRSQRLRRWQKNNTLDRHINSNNNNNDKKCYLHSQVLKIKEEEMQIGEYLMGEFGIYNINYSLDIWSRAVLPASPLGTKNNY